MSEQNECKEEYLKAFDQLPTNKKIVFTHKDYGLKSQIIFKEFENNGWCSEPYDTLQTLYKPDSLAIAKR